MQAVVPKLPERLFWKHLRHVCVCEGLTAAEVCALPFNVSISTMEVDTVPASCVVWSTCTCTAALLVSHGGQTVCPLNKLWRTSRFQACVAWPGRTIENVPSVTNGVISSHPSITLITAPTQPCTQAPHQPG